MPRVHGFLCQGCNDYIKDYADNHLCNYCAGEFRAIMRIYSQICALRLKARKLSPARLVQVLWAVYQRVHPE